VGLEKKLLKIFERNAERYLFAGEETKPPVHSEGLWDNTQFIEGEQVK